MSTDDQEIASVSVWRNPAYTHTFPDAAPITDPPPPPLVTTKGIRHELDDFFSMSHPFDTETLAHAPIVALIESSEGVQARCIRNPQVLLSLDDSTICIQSWTGRHRSDLFTYTVGQARPHLER